MKIPSSLKHPELFPLCQFCGKPAATTVYYHRLYACVRHRYPTREELATYFKTHPESGTYWDFLSAQDVTFQQSDLLPCECDMISSPHLGADCIRARERQLRTELINSR